MQHVQTHSSLYTVRTVCRTQVRLWNEDQAHSLSSFFRRCPRITTLRLQCPHVEPTCTPGMVAALGDLLYGSTPGAAGGKLHSATDTANLNPPSESPAEQRGNTLAQDRTEDVCKSGGDGATASGGGGGGGGSYGNSEVARPLEGKTGPVSGNDISVSGERNTALPSR